jgi:uncharacterized damage-inducible protein DinB
MDVAELFADLAGRVREHVEEVLDGLDADALVWAPAEDANPIGWLIWHLTRVEDAHVTEILGSPQVWESGEWASGVGVEADPANSGYGHSTGQVREIRPHSAEILRSYHRAVAARTAEWLKGLSTADLDRVVDERWDPPVTLGVRLVSIFDDQIQHAGQAAYLRGLLDGR